MKHKELVRAWLDGATIQQWGPFEGWKDLHTVNESSSVPSFFYDYHDFRIKPAEQWIAIVEYEDLSYGMWPREWFSSKEKAMNAILPDGSGARIVEAWKVPNKDL